MKNVLLNEVNTVTTKIIFYCCVIFFCVALILFMSITGISIIFEDYNIEVIDIVIGFGLVINFDIIPIILVILCVKRVKYLRLVFHIISYIESKVSKGENVINIHDVWVNYTISEKDMSKLLKRVSHKISGIYSLNDMTFYKNL